MKLQATALFLALSLVAAAAPAHGGHILLCQAATRGADAGQATPGNDTPSRLEEDTPDVRRSESDSGQASDEGQSANPSQEPDSPYEDAQRSATDESAQDYESSGVPAQEPDAPYKDVQRSGADEPASDNGPSASPSQQPDSPYEGAQRSATDESATDYESSGAPAQEPDSPYENVRRSATDETASDNAPQQKPPQGQAGGSGGFGEADDSHGFSPSRFVERTFDALTGGLFGQLHDHWTMSIFSDDIPADYNPPYQEEILPGQQQTILPERHLQQPDGRNANRNQQNLAQQQALMWTLVGAISVMNNIRHMQSHRPTRQQPHSSGGSPQRTGSTSTVDVVGPRQPIP